MDQEIPNVSGESYIDLALDTIKQKRQALIFNNSKRGAEKSAEDISKYVKDENKKWKEISEELLHVLSSPTKQCRRLAKCAEKGVAFHHSGLTSRQREIIEDNFRTGDLMVISSTPTLCLSGDTKIWHEIDETEVSKFRVSNLTFVLSQNNIKLMKAQKIERLENNSKLIQISSVCGYSIKVTQNHKMLVKINGKKMTAKAKDVKKNDRIATIGKLSLRKTRNPSLNEFVKENKLPIKNRKFDTNISYFIGTFIGDGYSGGELIQGDILYKGSPAIVGNDEEVFAHTIKVCKELNLSCKKKVMPSGTDSRILGKNNWFREFLVRCGVDKGKKKHISNKLMKMDLENTSALLRGLFDTDGFVQKGQCIGFSNTSEKLIQQTQKLLLRFGIIARIKTKKAGTMQIYNKEYKTLPCYEISIYNKKCILDFYKYIGFNIKRKQNTLTQLVEKINANINYISCQKCNYKLYKYLFSGRTKHQKEWGRTKFKVINLLGNKRELGSREIKEIIKEEPKKKESRLNHHYELIKKRRIGSRSNSDWFWSLNEIGKWISKQISKPEDFNELFNQKNCPICKNKLDVVIKRGWKYSDFEGDIYWDIVKRVEEKDVEKEVYDVVLPQHAHNDHFFVAEGFIVHNSLGLDLPAYRAIIRDTKRYEKRGMRDIPVMEYHQICGRAGRPGKESEGQAIVVCSNEKQAKVIINKYIYGKPEDILSKLAVEPVLRMYLLSLVSTEFISDKKGMIDFFSESFWAHQYEDIFEIEKILEHTVDLLSEWNFIETDKKTEKKDNFLSALSLGSNSNYKLIATRLGKRISELYIDPLSAYELILNLRRANDSDNELFSYIYSIISTNEMKPYLGVKQNEWDKIEMRAELMKKEIPSEVPEAWDEEYEDFLSLIKMCFLIESWIDERGEDWILENYSIRPGELQYKLQNADWLLYCSQEISRMLELKNSQRKLSELRLRVKYGVKKELLALLKLKGIGRVRARILYASKIKDLGDVKKADIKVLARLVGPELAKSVKEQVGENVKIDSKDLRKELAKKKSGQLVLGDYGA